MISVVEEQNITIINSPSRHKIMATAAVLEGTVLQMQDHGKPGNDMLQAQYSCEALINEDQINDSIFVMLKENPDPESGIQKAVNLLVKLNKDLFRIRNEIQERQLDERQASERLYRLQYTQKSFKSKLTYNGKQLASLKRDLDGLTFPDNAYKQRANTTEEKINNHNLCFLMHHGTNNMAEEKKLLKGLNASQKNLGDHCDSGPSVIEEINDKIRELRWSIRRNSFIPKPVIRVDEKQVLKEINELKWARDKAFANAPVKGKVWNSLPSISVTKKQIKLKKEASSDEEKKQHLEVKAKIVVRREINDAKKKIASLNWQLLNVRRKKGQAFKVILKLIKTQNQLII